MGQMTNPSRTYKGVWVMKLIMAYLVVAIHTTDWSLMGLLDTAVPFFFLASGFFLFRKLGGERDADLGVIRQWTGKALRLYLVWTAVYLPFTVVGMVQDGLSLKMALALFLRNLVFVGENFLSWPLWYLLALVWGGVLIWLLRLLKVPVWGMFLAGVGLFLLWDVTDFGTIPLVERIFRTGRNGIFFGLMFLAAGGLLWQWVSRGPLVMKPLLWDLALTGVSFVLYQWNHYFLLPLAAGLFLLAVRIDLPALSERTARRIGGISKYIYLTHMIFAGLAILLLHMQAGWLLWALSALCATLLSLALTRERGNLKLGKA